MAALSDAQLMDVVQRYFGDLGPGVVNGMFNIAKRESGGNPGAHNLNPATRDDSWGLWQINVRPDANPRYASWDLTDPEQNAKAARELYNAAGPTPWSTYNAAQDAAMFGGAPSEYGQSGQAIPMSADYGAPASAAYQPNPPPMFGYDAAALAQGAARQMYMGGVAGPHAEAAPATSQPAAAAPPMQLPDSMLLPLLRDSTSIWGGKLPDPLAAMYPMLSDPGFKMPNNFNGDPGFGVNSGFTGDPGFAINPALTAR